MRRKMGSMTRNAIAHYCASLRGPPGGLKLRLGEMSVIVKAQIG
jgi:hypothetical protein